MLGECHYELGLWSIFKLGNVKLDLCVKLTHLYVCWSLLLTNLGRAGEIGDPSLRLSMAPLMKELKGSAISRTGAALATKKFPLFIRKRN